MQKYSKHVSSRTTSQGEAIPGKDMVENSAGGFSFKVDGWDQLNRFLVLGTMGGTYYASESKLTKDNADHIFELIKNDGLRVVETVVQISEAGRAPNNDPALFVLALCASCNNAKVRKAARAALPKVARIGTHLFHFAEYFKAQSGMGRGIRNAYANWYTDKSVKDLSYQVMKYQQRDGWSHRDILRLAHPETNDSVKKSIFDWVAHGKKEDYEVGGNLPDQMQAFIELPTMGYKTAAKIIHEHKLTLDMVPKELLSHNEVWEALLDSMPLGALVRNLGQLTERNIIAPMSDWSKFVVKRLSNEEAIRKSRLHPLSVLVAERIYASGRGMRGSKTWDPVAQIIDALDGAFYTAFGNVQPTNKNTMLALDVSGSMTWGTICGAPLTPREGTGAMAMVTAQVEPNYQIMAFSHELVNVDISKKTRLDDVINTLSQIRMGGTDCALPMIYAAENEVPVDTFVVYTDSETWAGHIHPCQALTKYRNKMGIPAKLVVVGMVSNRFTIADPNDSGMLDVVGFDTATPNIISDFSA